MNQVSTKKVVAEVLDDLVRQGFMSRDDAQRYIATRVEPEAAAGERARRAVGVSGVRASRGPQDDAIARSLAAVDSLMGVRMQSPDEPAVARDPRTGGLTISALRPVKLAKPDAPAAARVWRCEHTGKVIVG